MRGREPGLKGGRTIRGTVRRVVVWLAIAATLGSLVSIDPGITTAQTPAGKRASSANFVQGEVLVRFRPGVSAMAIVGAHATVGARVIRTFRLVDGLARVALPAGIAVEEAIRRYRQNPDVLYAEPNFLVRKVVAPNDPHFGELWGLLNTGQAGGIPDADIDATEAWDTSIGSRSVVVAVIDTGIDYNHPDLAANMWRNEADCNTNAADDDGNGFINDCYGIDTINNDTDPMDDEDHGTHLGGTIGAVGNNSVGVVGVNWQVSLMACKFLGPSGVGTLAGAIACLDYVGVMKDRGVNVVATNNSWGSGAFSLALQNAIDTHRQRGILFIAAAGNDGTDNDFTPHYPSNYYIPNVIAVAATTRFDTLASFSRFGRRTVHVGAPGSQILSTVRTANPVIYDSFSGTSMATPHVAGVAALLNAQDASRDWRAIKNLILAGGDVVTATTRTITQRRLNARGAMGCSGTVVRSRLRPIPSFVVVASGSAVDLAALHINCANPNGSLQVTVSPGNQTVTLVDDGQASDQVAQDGIYSARWTPAARGVYALTFPDNDVMTVSVGPTPYGRIPGPLFALRSITGTNLNLSDDSAAEITSPFPISFAGGSFTKLYVGSNGYVSFTGPFTGFINAAIPSSSQFSGTLVAPFWDDLRPVPSSSKNVFWAVEGSAPNRELVIEWRDVGCFEDPGNTGVRFQIVFLETAPVHPVARTHFLFLYKDVVFGGGCSLRDWGWSATTGVQLSETLGTQYSFNTGSLTPDSFLEWTLPNPVLSVTPESQDFGSVAVGGTVDRTFTVQNSGESPLIGSANTNTPFGVLSGGSFDLPFNATHVVTIRFNPTTAGSFSTNVDFMSNAGNVSRPVTGTGIPAQSYLLTVNKTGNGTGTVTSSPAGINCGATCSASFIGGTVVTLTPNPDSGSGFAGWTAPCSGMGACSFPIPANTTITATFALPTFADVPPSDWGFGWIHQIYQRGVTAGCATNPSRYCPDSVVSRAQMAVFLVKSMGQTPCDTCAQTFTDVPPNHWAFGWIERIAQLGITAGCATNPSRYCPDDAVTRAQMAVFLNRAANQQPCTTCSQTFADVPTTHLAFGWIERLFQRGITAGCAASPMRYCPDNSVTRREMAVFLIRNFP